MLNKVIQRDQYRSILCLNGELPEKDFFSCDLPIIAADGAANQLAQMGVQPRMIIGDLDSAHESVRENCEMVHRENQDTGDYQKSLAHLQEIGLLPAIVVGISGGHLDHILNNINLFMQSDSVLYAPPLIGFVLKKTQTHCMTLPPDTKLSLIGIPHATLSTRGLKWELNQHTLTFPGHNSCFNRTRQTAIEINVLDGQVLVLIYTQAIEDAGIN